MCRFRYFVALQEEGEGNIWRVKAVQSRYSVQRLQITGSQKEAMIRNVQNGLRIYRIVDHMITRGII